MKFIPLELPGVFLIESVLVLDDRGAFGRTWCQREFEEHGLSTQLSQCNVSITLRRGTIRGMHFQRPPYAEIKLVRCTRGAIFDVIIDLRPESQTFCQWIGRELTAENHRMLYVPEGFAHGFQALTDDVEVFYQTSQEHHSASAAGVKWNDPAINVLWPLPVSVILPRDASWPDISVPNSDHR